MASGKPVTAPDDTSELFQIRGTSIDELREKAGLLIVDHYHEIAVNKEVMKLSPDWDQYLALEENDRLVSLAACLGSEMVGYSVSQVCLHLHYKGLKFLANDVVFLAEEHRHSGVGEQLIDATIEMARKTECKMITIHAKPGSVLARMLGGRGFRGIPEHASLEGWIVQDIVFSKVL